MPEPLVHIIRSEQVESVHFGDAVVVDKDGNIVMQIGNPEQMTYLRSTAKPFQAIPILSTRAYDQFGFSEEELAIACASHYAEEGHIAVVKNMLKKTGFSEKDLLCGITPPLKLSRAFEILQKGKRFSQIHSDCSGKHAGMLAVCRTQGWSTKTYTEPNHPLQRMIKNIIADFSGIDEGDLVTGIDGCTVPTFYLSIRQLAVMYSRLVLPEITPEAYAGYAPKIVKAMIENPFMISGSTGFCTALIKAGQGGWIGKIGAEGVYAVGIRKNGIGIALKIANGNMDIIPPVILEIMKRLGVMSGNQLNALRNFIRPVIRDDRNRECGYIKMVF